MVGGLNSAIVAFQVAPGCRPRICRSDSTSASDIAAKIRRQHTAIDVWWLMQDLRNDGDCKLQSQKERLAKITNLRTRQLASHWLASALRPSLIRDLLVSALFKTTAAMDYSWFWSNHQRKVHVIWRTMTIDNYSTMTRPSSRPTFNRNGSWKTLSASSRHSLSGRPIWTCWTTICFDIWISWESRLH